MRYFHNFIFMGNGDHSEAQCQKLHQLLDEAFSLMSGQQQSGGQGSMPDPKEMMEAGERDLEDVVRDVAAAILGRYITIGRRCPSNYQGVRPSNLEPTGINHLDSYLKKNQPIKKFAPVKSEDF